MVRSSATLFQSKSLRLSQCNPPSRGHLATRHLLHHARWLQRPPHTGALRPSNIQKRHSQLPHAVRIFDYVDRDLNTWLCTDNRIWFLCVVLIGPFQCNLIKYEKGLSKEPIVTKLWVVIWCFRSLEKCLFSSNVPKMHNEPKFI